MNFCNFVLFGRIGFLGITRSFLLQKILNILSHFLSYPFLKQVFLLGALAKLGATVVTYPLLVVKVTNCIKTIILGIACNQVRKCLTLMCFQVDVTHMCSSLHHYVDVNADLVGI